MTPVESVDIWVVASTMTDMIAYVPRMPDAGETIVGTAFTLGFGGKGANQAVMARRLGASVGVIGCVGDDVFGDMTRANFEREGIDVRELRRAGGASSGAAPIWVEPSGTNRIIVVPGANLLLTPEEAAAAMGRAKRVDVVVGQCEMPQEATAAAFRVGRERRAITILNPAPSASLRDDLLAVTDWLVPNEVEFADIAQRVLGRSADARRESDIAALREALGVQIVVTLGEIGAAVCAGDEPVRFVSPPVVAAIDTTGAGDAFVGAFAFGLASGLSPLDAVRLGCTCASASVTRRGTQSSFPSREEAQILCVGLMTPEHHS